MSGQSANLTLKESKAMQERVQYSGSHSSSNGGSSTMVNKTTKIKKG